MTTFQTGSRLLRFLLSLIRVRIRQSVSRVALTLRTRFASLWGSLLAHVRLRGQSRAGSQIRLDANDIPAIGSITPVEEHFQNLEHEEVEEEEKTTLATQPVLGIAYLNDELVKCEKLTRDHQFGFYAHPATPERGRGLQHSASGSVSHDTKPPENPTGQQKPLHEKGKGSEPPTSGTVDQATEPLRIPAGQQTLSSAVPLPPGDWVCRVHPKGNIFYYHKGLRLFTDNDVFRLENKILFCAMRLIQQARKMTDVTIDELTEIVLNMEDDAHLHYYFVDHTNRLLFWIHSVRPQEDLGTLQKTTEYTHIKYLVEAHYWYIACDMESRSHCRFYPHNRVLPRRFFEDLRGLFIYAKTDMMMNDFSHSSPFAQNELVTMHELVDSFKDERKICHPHSIWFIARLMASFTENQFLNFRGQSGESRLLTDTLLGKQTWIHWTIFQLANVFLFGSPKEHVARLQRVQGDAVLGRFSWKDFVARLKDDLHRYTILSTVMLAVNFSFLTVPGFVTPGASAGASEIIIYCSVISTIASIMFSFALSNAYSNPGLMGTDFVVKAMEKIGRTTWGIECLAITHGLPIACLAWSITLFSTALAVQMFSPKERATMTTLGVECLVLVLFAIIGVVMILWLFWNDDVGRVDKSGQDSAYQFTTEA